MKDIDRIPRERQDDPGAVGIVVLCTANVCRSVMAAALLARRLSELGVAAHVRSAGMLRDGDIGIGRLHSDTELTGSLIQLGFYVSRISRGRDDESSRVVRFSSGLK